MENLEEKSPKYFFLLPVLLILIAVLGFINFRVNQGQKRVSETPSTGTVITSEPKTAKLTNLEIAKKTLNCLDKLRDERGVYAFGKECSSPTECRITARDNRVGLNVLWARTKYIEKTNDQKELEILRKDIDLYSNRELVKIIQPSFWGRSLLYQMWQSEIFSSSEKGKIKEIAIRAGPSESKEIDNMIQKVNSVNYQEPVITNLSPSKRDNLNKGDFSEFDSNLFSMAMVSSWDFLNWADWENSETSRKHAVEFFYQYAGSYYTATMNSKSVDDQCLLGFTSAGFYRFTRNPVFLELAQDIFQKANLVESCMSGINCPIAPLTSLTCGMFVNELSKVDNSHDYKNLKEKIIDNLVSVAFDYEGYRGFFTGDGCFYNYQSAGKQRSTKENGLIAGFLSE